MLDPTFNVQRESKPNRQTYGAPYGDRTGAIIPLFAILLPVLMILCGLAINLAYMQMVSTELKVATDASAHAAGRAMSVNQTTESAIAFARQMADENLVGGKKIKINPEDPEEDHLNVTFGISTRGQNGYGRYEFQEVDRDLVDSGTERATSVAVFAQVDLPLVFYQAPHTAFTAVRRSVATQIDRDIALVIDRSGSMLEYIQEEALTQTLEEIYNTYDEWTDPDVVKYHYWRRKNGSWKDKGYHEPDDAEGNWEIRDPDDTQTEAGQFHRERRISQNERDDATLTSGELVYYREFSSNTVYQIERYLNAYHTLGSSYSSSEINELMTPLAKYAADARSWSTGSWNFPSPDFSRWYYLNEGVQAFLDVLDITDQEELVSLVTFNSSATVEFALQENYDSIRNKVANIDPNGGTAAGDGMLEGLDPIINGSAARLFAAKTIVVLTDGVSNNGTDPEDAVEEIIGAHKVTIHTVTFGEGADQTTMQNVAAAGFGRHYHANDGDTLVDIFEEIANNLPTILTE